MKLRSLVAGLGAGILLFSANTALAETPAPAPVPAMPVEAGPTLVTVFGTGISLSITTDATGHLTAVDLTGGVQVDGAVATEVSPHEVKFVIGAGSTQIEVKAKGKSVKTEVEASALADLMGMHSWKGELFGVGNGETTVAFTVGGTDSAPTITDVVVGGPFAGTPVVTQSGSEAKARIELTDGMGHDARITIKVEVEDDDGQVEAELKISARSDLFATVEAVGPVADPTVNVPVDEKAQDDDADHEDHDSDRDDDQKDHDSDDDDADHEDHESDREVDHEDDHGSDSGHDDESGHDGQHQQSKGHDAHDSHDD